MPVRKPGKLPWDTHAHSYELEYGSDTLEVHRDALAPDDRVLIVDDVLATGGTATATCRLVSSSSRRRSWASRSCWSSPRWAAGSA